MNFKKVFSNLKNFYRNEAQGIGHYPEDLFELGWQLANLLDAAGPDSNAWKPYPNMDDDIDQHIAALRNEPSVVMIDQTINMMHQGLLDELDWSGSESEMMLVLGGDIAEYLLNRE
jgi:hypothetical protein